MDATTVEALKTALAPVAEKIGQGAEFGWDVVVKQQIVEAWLGVFWAAIGAVGLIGAIFVWRWAIKYEKEHVRADGGAIMFSVLATFIALIPFTLGSIVAITHFINPEFYALSYFLTLAGSVGN